MGRSSTNVRSCWQQTFVVNDATFAKRLTGWTMPRATLRNHVGCWPKADLRRRPLRIRIGEESGRARTATVSWDPDRYAGGQFANFSPGA